MYVDTTNVVFEEGVAGPARKQWANEGGQPLVAMLQVKTIQTATYAVGKDELSEFICAHTYCYTVLMGFFSRDRWSDKNGGDTSVGRGTC